MYCHLFCYIMLKNNAKNMHYNTIELCYMNKEATSSQILRIVSIYHSSFISDAILKYDYINKK